MERYYGFYVESLWKLQNLFIDTEQMKYWILYQTCEDGGKTICVQASQGSVYKISHIVPGSLSCILYIKGDGCLFEHLKEEEESGILDVEKLLVKKALAYESKVQEELSGMESTESRMPEELSKDVIRQITVSENGFLVDSPIHSKKATGGKYECVQIWYKPNKKKLEDRVIDKISCWMQLEKSADYEEVFLKVLEKEVSSKEESMDLYDKLEEYSLFYTIDGDGTFIMKELGKESRLFYKGRFLKIKGKSSRDMFANWISKKWEGTLNKAKVLGSME